MKLFPDHLQRLEKAAPDVTGDGLEELWSKAGLPYRREKTDSSSGLMVIPAAGSKVGRVGMFRGRIMDVMFASTNVNTVQAGASGRVRDCHSGGAGMLWCACPCR